MTKRISIAFFLLAALLLMGGCHLRTVDEMYSLPKRSREYQQLQIAIDKAMQGLEYCAPASGENRQTVQTADLDGDGQEEFLLFARGSGETPLRIFLFRQTDGVYARMGTIQLNGSAFDQVEYADIDGRPGLEVVVGSQISDQVLRSVAVYSFAGGETEQLMSTQYARFLSCDLDSSRSKELMVLLPGTAEGGSGTCALYHFQNGTMERSGEVSLSRPVDNIKRIMVGRLHGGNPAVYIASSVDERAIITDIFAIKDEKFTNISFSNESGTSVGTLRNYYVYADDLDGDGVLELPALITMPEGGRNQQYLIRWFSVDIQGNEITKLHTFHNYLGGWYVTLEGEWAARVGVIQQGGTYSFHVWNQDFTQSQQIMALFVLTGDDREEQALADRRFVLHRTESVVYAAKLEASSVPYGITQDSLIECFQLIRQDRLQEGT